MPNDPTPSPQEKTPPMPNLRLTSSPADEPAPKVQAATSRWNFRNMPGLDGVAVPDPRGQAQRRFPSGR